MGEALEQEQAGGRWADTVPKVPRTLDPTIHRTTRSHRSHRNGTEPQGSQPESSAAPPHTAPEEADRHADHKDWGGRVPQVKPTDAF